MKEEVSYILCLLSVFFLNTIPSHVTEVSDLGSFLVMIGPTSIIMYDVTVLLGVLILILYNYYFKVSGIVSFLIGLLILIFCLIEFQYGVIYLGIRYTTVVFSFTASLILGSLPTLLYSSSRNIGQRLIEMENNSGKR